MTAIVVPFAPVQRMASPRGWRPSEIAEVYRVIDLLGRAGLPVFMESGRSDEGDPWLVVIREDTQEAIVHIARIDDRIVAASVANDRVFTGATLEAALQNVLGTQPLVLPSGGARLFLHPATILAAFVATALAHSGGGMGEAAPADSQNAAVAGLDAGPRHHAEGPGLTHRSAEGNSYSLSMVAAAVAVVATAVALTSDGVQPTSFSDPLQLLATLSQTTLKTVEYGQQIPTEAGGSAGTACDIVAHAMLGDLPVAGSLGLEGEHDPEQIQITITLAPEAYEQITPAAAFDDGQVRVAAALSLTGATSTPQSLAYEPMDDASPTGRVFPWTLSSFEEISELASPSMTPARDTPGAFGQSVAVTADKQAYSSLGTEVAARVSVAAAEKSIFHGSQAQSAAIVDKGDVVEVPNRAPGTLGTAPHQGSASSTPTTELTIVHFNDGEAFYWQGVSLLGLLDDQDDRVEKLATDVFTVPSTDAQLSLKSTATATLSVADVSGAAQVAVSAVDPPAAGGQAEMAAPIVPVAVTDGSPTKVAAPAVVVEPMMIKVPLGVSAEAKAQVLTEFAHGEAYELQVTSRVEHQLSLIVDANPYLTAVDRVILFDAPSIKPDMFMLMPGIAMVRSDLIAGNTNPVTTTTPQAEFTLTDGTMLRLLGVMDI